MEELVYKQGDVVANQLGQHYKIIDVLGEGNSGVTYAAEDATQPGVNVALKVLSFQQTSDWKTLELFKREAKVLAQLQHSGIPHYFDSFYLDTENDRQFYIVQELAKGKSLAAWVESGWHADEAMVKHIAEQILEILIYLQKLQPPVIHRDIKPSNIIRDEDGSVFLVDFGAVRDTYYTTVVHGSTVVGTFGYMAPEQFCGQALPATDIYGLAATLLFLLTHRSPTELPTKDLGVDFRSKVQISEGFANWLEKAIAPDVNDRFVSAQEALDTLRKPQILVKQNSQVSPLKTIAAFTVAIGCLFWVGNELKWKAYAAFGFLPRGICNTPMLKEYLKHGGNPNIKVNKEIFDLNNEDAPPNFLFRFRAIDQPPDIDKYLRASRYDLESTPLIFCASKEGTNILLKSGAKVNIPESGNLILYKATFSNEPERVKQLLEHGISPNSMVTSEYDNAIAGVPVLHKIISNDAVLSSRLSFNNVTNSQYIKDTQNAQYQIAQLLIKYGADVNLEDSEGNTALISVLSNNIYYAQGNLSYLVKQNQIKFIELLINNGAKMNTRNKSHLTPLHIAVQKTNIKAIEFLIQNGADVNAINSNGNSAIQEHFERNIYTSDDMNNFTVITKLLIKNSANLNLKNKKGNTVLQEFMDKRLWIKDRENFVNIIEILIKNGTDVNLKNNDGNTALHYAMGNTNVDKMTIELLIKNGADINAKNSYGYSPLDSGLLPDGDKQIIENQMDKIKTLLAKGAKTTKHKNLNAFMDF